ncbi:MAG TPA: hypothetical protein VMG09_13105, partial [Bacteroidota bacterium]|nr:hypothetical protein [Bacteroidota bacterium]
RSGNALRCTCGWPIRAVPVGRRLYAGILEELREGCEWTLEIARDERLWLRLMPPSETSVVFEETALESSY